MSLAHDLPADPRAGRDLLPTSGPGGFAPAPAPLKPVAAPEGSDPLGLLRAFRRRWPLAVGLGLATALAVAAAAWKLVPPAQYTASAMIRMNSIRPALIYGKAKEAEVDFRVYQQTQLGLLRSRMVLEKALETQGVANLPVVRAQEDAYEWLLKQLKVKVQPQNENVELTLSADRPTQAAQILRAVVDAYMDQFGNDEAADRAKQLVELERLYKVYQEDLARNRKKLQDSSKSAGANDKETLALMTSYAHENAANANNVKMSVARQIMEREAEVKVLEAKLKARPLSPAPAPAADPKARAATAGRPTDETDPEILRLQGKIAGLDVEIQKSRGIIRNHRTDPAARKFMALKDAAVADLDARREALAKAAAAGVVPGAPGVAAAVADPIAARLAEAKDELRRFRLVEEQITAQVKAYEEKAQAHNANAHVIQAEQEQVALDNELVKLVGGRLRQLEVESNARARVQVVDMPTPPKTKDELKKLKVVGALAAGVFGLVTLGVTFLEFRARRIGSIAQVERSLGLRLVGSLPSPTRALPGRSGGSRALAAAQARSRLIESVDATRTMLLHASRTEAIRVVMITSAVKGEGKTSLSSHLATSLARAGRRTLLVDCDLRRPALHRLFDLPQGPGMCELLRGEVDLASVVHRAPAGELDVVPAGRCDPSALQMLARDQARRIFDAMAAEYDFVIVDTSPVLPVADALLLSQQVDAVIFSILHEVSCVPRVQLAHDKLASLGARVMGAVVNGATGSNYGYDGYQVYDQAKA